MGSFDTEDRPFEQEMALSEPDYRLLVDQVQAAVFVIQKGRFLFVNPKLLELFGYSREEMLRGMDPMLLCVPEHRDMVREQTNARVAGVPGKAYEVECLRKNGERFSAQVWGVRIFLSAQAADLVTLHDVSAIQAATRYAQQRVQLFRNAEELARIGSAEVDLVSGTVTLSSGMHAILGIPLTETPPGTDWLLARVPPVERPYVQAISEGVSPDDVCEFQHRIVHTDGSLRTVLHRVLAEADEGGKVIRTVTLLQDITLQRAAEQKLDKLANTDEITGLPNRNALTEYLDTKMREAARGGRHIAVLSVEIDRLKLVSESLGHAAGDQLLMEVGRRLQPQVSQDDLLAHFGSGEFSLVLVREESVDEAMARGTAASLVDALSLPVAIGDNEIKVTCDIGISLYPVHGDDPEKLLQQAQAAMYRAHELGKNQICVFSSGMHSKAISRLVMESGLRRALERNEFELHFQPKLELVSGAIIGAEAFLEWKSPDGALISRSSYIRAAEETGLIVPIGAWVMRTACAHAKQWQGLVPGQLRVAVNLAASQLYHDDLVGLVGRTLADTGLDADCLDIELTEGQVMADVEHALEVMQRLKAMGVKLSLDDFGTGYSSLAYLKRFPIDVLKIDKSFVRNLTTDADDAVIARSIITLGQSLQLQVIAEGVETEEQFAYLRRHRCDQIQGYFFSRPLAAEDFERLLAGQHAALRAGDEAVDEAGGQPTLLIVDDEENVAASLHRLLRRDGYRILRARSGPEGLALLAMNQVQVVLSDERMPGMNGTEFLARVKAIYPDTIRIMLSGYTAVDAIIAATNSGAVFRFHAKPWDDNALRGSISEAFRYHWLIHGNSPAQSTGPAA